MTFDVGLALLYRIDYSWQHKYEAFCICRNCSRSTTFLLEQKDLDHKQLCSSARSIVEYKESLNDFFNTLGYLSLKDTAVAKPPDHVPENIQRAFREGATCVAVECWNAAGVMFRACIDLATRSLLPPEGTTAGPDNSTRRVLARRLEWIFTNQILPLSMKDLASAVREDGNDGAHQVSLTQADCADLEDFTVALLERLYTEPKKLDLAKERREKRRGV